MITDKNADRFNGFANIYDSARPTCPNYVVKILKQYLRKSPDMVVDIGCGTGLSTLVWKDSARQVIGVEPSDDMRNIAIKNSKSCDNVRYICAFSGDTGLPDNTIDIVTCSQSFHWMEPNSTLKEIDRILKSDGIFATYDCDWPPVCCAEIEVAYRKLMDKVSSIESNIDKYKDSFIRYSKEQHLKNIESSGYFTYTREIVFANTEKCDAKRYFDIAISQGGLQAILKDNPTLIENELVNYKTIVDTYFDDKILDIDFCYRMRMGVK